MKIKLFYNKTIKNNYAISLFILLIGIFLLPKIVFSAGITSDKLFELTNQERSTNNINALTANQLLTQAAFNKASDILKFQTFQHNFNDKKFSDWIKSTGYIYSYVGENLAIDFATSEGIFKAWLDSPAHKKNIMEENFTEIGIAAVEGKFNNKNTIVVAQIFGAPPHASAALLTMRDNPIFKTDFNSGLLNNESLLTHSAGSLIFNSNSISLTKDKPNKSFVQIMKNDYTFHNNFYFSILALLFIFCFYASYFHKLPFPTKNNIR